MIDFETTADYIDFAGDIGVSFQDAMKYEFACDTMAFDEELKHNENAKVMTAETYKAIADCIENMKECISSFEYYSKEYNKNRGLE